MALITACRIEAYQRSLPGAVLAQRAVDVEACWLMHIELESGFVGVGDVAPWPGFSEAPAVIHAQLQALVQTVSGVSLPALHLVPGWLEERASAPVVRHGLEGAILSLLAQLEGVPLAQYLWASPPAEVPVHGLVETLAEAKQMLAAGVKTLKIKVGGNIARDAKRVVDLQQHCPAAQLRLDANGHWSREETLDFLRKVGDVTNIILEQPTRPDDLGAFGWLKARHSVALAADESVVTAAESVIADPAVDHVVLKPMFLGGLLAVDELAHRAKAQGKGVCITHALESSIGRYNALALASVFSHDGPHGVSGGDWPIVNGCISYPQPAQFGAAV